MSKPKKAKKVGSDLVETPMPAADFLAAAGALQEVKLDTECIYAPGGSCPPAEAVKNPRIR